MIPLPHFTFKKLCGNQGDAYLIGGYYHAIIGESFKKGVRYLPLSPKQPVEIGIAIPKKDELSPAAKRFAEFASKSSVSCCNHGD